MAQEVLDYSMGWLLRYSHSIGGCCLAGLAGWPDTPRNCCFSSIMSSAGAESCPWTSIYTVCQSTHEIVYFEYPWFKTWMFPTLIVYRVYQNQPRRVDLARCQMCHKREEQLVNGSLENLRKKRFMLYHDVYMWCILVYMDIHSISQVYQFKKR